MAKWSQEWLGENLFVNKEQKKKEQKVKALKMIDSPVMLRSFKPPHTLLQVLSNRMPPFSSLFFHLLSSSLLHPVFISCPCPFVSVQAFLSLFRFFSVTSKVQRHLNNSPLFRRSLCEFLSLPHRRLAARGEGNRWFTKEVENASLWKAHKMKNQSDFWFLSTIRVSGY